MLYSTQSGSWLDTVFQPTPGELPGTSPRRPKLRRIFMVAGIAAIVFGVLLRVRAPSGADRVVVPATKAPIAAPVARVESLITLLPPPLPRPQPPRAKPRSDDVLIDRR